MQRVLQEPRVRGLAPHEVTLVVHVLVVRCCGRWGDRGWRRRQAFPGDGGGGPDCHVNAPASCNPCTRAKGIYHTLNT